MKGKVIQLQNFSVNDGDGIRTNIFLAGCPLNCLWCSNPEGKTATPKIGWHERLCIGCGACAAGCPQHIGVNMNADGERARCVACGACVAACPRGARVQYVTEMSVDEIAKALESQLDIFRMSGGGVTLSGGEPTAQVEFFNALTQRLYDMGLDIDVETSSYNDFDAVRPGLARMRQIFADIKQMDDAKHRQFTGVSNARILENIKQYASLPAEVIIRVPTIVGVNADAENIRATARFVHRYLPKARMELLPYHKFGVGKYEALGLPLPPDEFKTPSAAMMEELNSIITAEGVALISFR